MMGSQDDQDPKPSLTPEERAVLIARGTGQPTSEYIYAFNVTSPANQYDTPVFTEFTAQQKDQAIEAMQAWADVANVTFRPAQAGETPTINFENEAMSDALINAYTNSDGYIFINSNNADQQLGPALFTKSRQSLIHEIGHVIGLEHPGIYNDRSGTSYSNDALYVEDTYQYTVMSYFSERNANESDFKSLFPAGPMLDDIAAAQIIYGSNVLTRIGNTIYGYNAGPEVPDYYRPGQNGAAFSIWDSGGYDMLDLSGDTHHQIIDLRSAEFSSAFGLVNNISIAVGTTIESAKAGSGGSTIHGNAAANLIYGGAGNDVIFGDQGDDVFVGSAGSDTIDGGADRDVLSYALSGASGMHIGQLFATTDMSSAWKTSAGTSYVNVEEVIGTMSPDVFEIDPSGTASGATSFRGLDGDDLFLMNSNSTSITIEGGQGVDTVDYSHSPTGVTIPIASLTGIEIVSGSTHNDVLPGIVGATMNGGPGSDVFVSMGLGTSFIANGIDETDAPSDTLDLSLSNVGLVVDLSSGSISNGDSFDGIDVIMGTNHGDQFITDPNSHTNIIAGSGNDTFHFTDGFMSFDGGSGQDTIVLHNSSSVYVPFGFIDSNSYIYGELSFSSVEQIYGSSEDDYFLTNGSSQVTLHGGAGTDTISFSMAPSNYGQGLTINATDYPDFEIVYGSPYSDAISARPDMTIGSGGGHDTIYGAAHDTIYTAYGTGSLVYMGVNSTMNSYGRDAAYLTSGDAVIGNGGVDIKATIGAVIFIDSGQGAMSDSLGNHATGILTYTGSVQDDHIYLTLSNSNAMDYVYGVGAGTNTLHLVGGGEFAPDGVYSAGTVFLNQNGVHMDPVRVASFTDILTDAGAWHYNGSWQMTPSSGGGSASSQSLDPSWSNLDTAYLLPSDTATEPLANTFSWNERGLVDHDDNAPASSYAFAANDDYAPSYDDAMPSWDHYHQAMQLMQHDLIVA